jgi:hypothetical protein
MDPERNTRLRIREERAPPAPGLNPAWIDFIRFCSELRHGEIERLAIQDGLPVIAETTRKKIKFR